MAYTRYWGVEHGLSHRDVQCVFQDKQGFIWLGTRHGLNRYDGYQFKTFTKEKNNLQSNAVNHILGDSQGYLWLFHTTNHLFKAPSSIDIFDPVTEKVVSFEQKFGDSAPFDIKDIFSFAASPDGKIAFSTTNHRLIIYTPGRGFKVSKLGLQAFTIHVFSKSNTLWGYQYNLQTGIGDAIVEMDLDGDVLYSFQPDYPIQNMFIADQDSQGNLWFIIKKGIGESIGELYKITNRQQPQKIVLNQKGLPIDSLNLNRVGTGGRFQFWLNPGQGAFYLYSANSFQVFHPQHKWYFELEPNNKFLGNTNAVFFDKRGRAWVGTEFGLYQIEITSRRFQQILGSKKESNYRAFRGITQDKQGNILASNDKGDGWLWKIQKTQYGFQTSKYDTPDNISGLELGCKYGLYSDSKGALWFGSGPHNRIVKFETQTGQLSSWRMGIPRRIESLQVNIWSFYEDELHRIWFGSDAGRIGYIDNNGIMILPELKGVNEAGGCIYQFLKDKKGRTWLATDNGLYTLNTTKKTTTRYAAPAKEMPWREVYHIHEDADGTFWLGTKESGLVHWSPEKGLIRQFTKTDGLSNNTIYGVYEDENHYLWMPSDYGIIRFNKNNYQSLAYLKKDGITHDEFNRISHFQSSDGALFFGGLNGITAISPAQFNAESEETNIPLVITAFQQFSGNENKLMDKKNELLESQTIHIRPGDRFFFLEFALLAFEQMDHVQYAYKIEKIDDEWVYQKANSIRMSRLPYGKHLLRIKGQAPDGHWSDSELRIVLFVSKPFYLQFWFLIASGLLAIGLAFMLIRRRTAELHGRQAKLEAEVARQTATIRKQADELQTLDELKNRFFANISHELRTPLTLILGPLDEMIKSGQWHAENLHLLKIAQENAQNVLKQIAAILDLSKIEAHKFELQEKPQALFPLIRRLISNFESHAQHLGIHYYFEYHADKNLYLLIDAERLETVINNLLSNAMKFTAKEGAVTVRVYDDLNEIRIEVQDTGRGILESDLPHVFDRFYRSDIHLNMPAEGGSGIGLSLAKELVLLMGGQIEATSQWQKGSCFTFKIPRKEVLGSREIPQDQQIAEVEQQNQFVAAGGAIRASEPNGMVLLVEDNYSLRSYLESILSPVYEVVSTSNGAEALERLPDCINSTLWKNKGGIVLSDIMMPVMDGFQLCEQLKSDAQYASIPVIVLTARADIQDKLRALRIGVDDYLLKPFISDELLARIFNLLSRMAQRNALESSLNADEAKQDRITAAAISTENLAWLQNLEAIVQAAVQDDTLSVQRMADEVFMSERHLHRKLKAITGLSPLEYIREVRLQEARRLLENHLVDSVKKAAHKVCFNDEKYFARIFKERFGKNPSEIR